MTIYQYDQRPDTRITISSEEMLRRIRDSEYSVLVGRNNCGKSFLLKSLTQRWGENASFLGPARYQNFNLLGYYTPNRNRRSERWNQLLQLFNQQHQNIDNSPINLQQAIAELSDSQRDTLIEIVDLLLGVRLEMRHTVDGNSMSQQYISCDGHNISYTSSGFRLITTLVTSLLDTDYDTYLIDEPELGISPEAQGVLADFLFDRSHRQKYFSHIRTLVFATHSTVFLDRKTISNNYIVQKSGNEISINGISTQGELNKIHFFLLGNRFETLYLPSAIILVEGKCDHRFIERATSLRFPNAQLSIISANGDNRIKEILSVARGLLSDIQRSPYRDRIFVVLDAVHSAGLPEQLVQMGVPRENIVKWSLNGIEYYYPPELLDKIYGSGGALEVSGDCIIRNGLTYTKTELLERVVSQLESTTQHHKELEEKLLEPLSQITG
ncbi:MAG TPA: AAA family ATPase [Pyrinomonadaceae bacterium]|nr:AAA family ATPase [Pyrinomonadaceae bacterium]